MVENKATVHGVQLSCEVDAGIPVIEADPGQLQQVMINLMNNAIHAVVERNGSHGGKIDVAAHGDERGNAVITVKDNGSGMSQETLCQDIPAILSPPRLRVRERALVYRSATALSTPWAESFRWTVARVKALPSPW